MTSLPNSQLYGTSIPVGAVYLLEGYWAVLILLAGSRTPHEQLYVCSVARTGELHETGLEQ